MLRLFINSSLLFCFTLASGQIDPVHLSAGIYGNWEIGDKATYRIVKDFINVKGTDTTSREKISYYANLEITDKQFNAYTITWTNSNFVVDAPNFFLEAQAAGTDGISFVIRTDGMGVFSEIVNWETVRDSVTSLLQKFEAAHANPETAASIKQLYGMYATKDALHNTAIGDIKQFFAFHGAIYRLGEMLEEQSTTTNNFGGEPFRLNKIIALDEINATDDYAVMRMWLSVDAEQMTDAAYQFSEQYLKQLGAEVPPREKFPLLKNETRMISTIEGSTGWPILSQEIKEVSGENQLRIDTRTIQKL